MINRRHLIAASAGVAIPALVLPGTAAAQQDKMTRIIVGFPPPGAALMWPRAAWPKKYAAATLQGCWSRTGRAQQRGWPSNM